MMKTYAIVGMGGRGQWSYAEPLLREYGDCARLCAVCDRNLLRAQLVSRGAGRDIPAYTDFDRMLADHHPDVVIVTTVDRFHEQYIVRALEFGCGVITEKPMATDAAMCARIVEAERRTGRKVTVTFNCRFSPFFVRLKQLLLGGLVGDVFSVHFEWLLDTSHGADYFRRWHAIRANSGSLLIHKATHHFDLVNWLLEDEPVKVNAFGARRFYGDNRRPHGERCLTCPHKTTCEFCLDLETAEGGALKRLYLDCEGGDGYLRDRCLFSDAVDIEDTVSLNVRYARGAVMSYSLTAHSPYECMKLVLNGAKGRLEADNAFGEETIRFYNRGGECVRFDRSHAARRAGGHGGSDPALRDNLFRGYADDPLHQMAGTRAGAMSAGIGIAANRSMAEDRAVYLREFFGGLFPDMA